jgi:3'(2'), 5'-bisphosphate nucleotidase
VGVVGEGAWEAMADGTMKPIQVSDRETLAGARFVVSRSRTPARALALVDAVGGLPPRPHGSSGLKGALLATGEADVYLQPGNAGMRWDACATDALVRAAGGELTEADGEAFDYRSADLKNGRGMIGTNGHLHRALLLAIREAP